MSLPVFPVSCFMIHLQFHTLNLTLALLPAYFLKTASVLNWDVLFHLHKRILGYKVWERPSPFILCDFLRLRTYIPDPDF